MTAASLNMLIFMKAININEESAKKSGIIHAFKTDSTHMLENL